MCKGQESVSSVVVAKQAPRQQERQRHCPTVGMVIAYSRLAGTVDSDKGVSTPSKISKPQLG